MAENIKRHITHIKSKVVENNLPKLPTASQIQDGEIAVNYAKGYETLSIKNESGNVVTFETKQVHYGTCSTAAGTAKKLVTVDEPFVLKKGVIIAVKFTYANSASNVTLNVNSTGDKSIYYGTSVYTGNSTTVCGAQNRIHIYMYDGTYWTWQSHNSDDNTTYSTGTSAILSAGTDTTQRVWRADQLKGGMNALYQPKGSYLTGTTKYAGASSQGGAATSAEKLTNTSAIGSVTQPVFFTANGVPSATTYSLAKSVPSNAVFTDTATTLDGHFAPTAVTAGTKTANASSSTAASWGDAIVTGITLSGDAKGHITSVTVASKKLPSNPNTDVSVAQTPTSDNNNYEVLFSKSANNTAETGTTRKDSKLIYNPSVGRLNTTSLNQLITGSGTAASTGTSGSSTVYYPAKWTFNKSIVPSDGDIFTVKLPVAGHDYGTFVSLNNGTNYYPLAGAGASRIGGQYVVNNYVSIIYESGGTVNSVFPLTGGTSRVNITSGGAFRVINYYDSNTTDISYTNYNNALYKAAETVNRYQVCFKKDETSYIPASSTNNTTANTKTITTTEFDPFGVIFYFSSAGTVSANANFPSGTLHDGYAIDLRYSFNVANVLTAQKDVYAVCVPQSNGKVKFRNTTTTGATNGPISQTLPTTDDGYVYIYLGAAYNSSSIFLAREHPVYQFKNGQLRQYVGSFGTAAYKAEGYFAGSGHTHATSIATSTGTNQLTLGFGSKYSLNAGGTSYIFTMPSSASSWNNVTAVTTSSTNGNISVNGSNVAVKGLNTAAYKAEGYFAGSGHTHDGRYAKSAFTKVMINTTALDADSTGDTFTISGGSFVSLTADATNDKVTIAVSTGTSNSTVARGDHSHSGYAVTGRSISTASGLTGGGNLSADRTLGLAAVTVGGYEGSSVTSNTVSYDSYGRVNSAAPIIYSAVTISANQTNVTCPTVITGTSKSGAQANVIYVNNGSTTEYTVSVSTTNQISNTGQQLNLKCPKSGYCEINYLNIGGVIYVRGA